MWWFDPVRAREGNIREGTDESGLGGKAKRKSSPRCRLQLLGGYLRVCGWTCPRRVGSSSSGSRRESHRPHELRPCEVVDFTVAFLVPTRRRTSRGKLWVFNVFGCLFLGTWGGGGFRQRGLPEFGPSESGLQKSELRQVFQPSSSSLFFASSSSSSSARFVAKM